MFNFLVTAFDVIRYYKTVAELARLSNEELEELGMSRREIVFVAAKANNLVK